MPADKESTSAPASAQTAPRPRSKVISGRSQLTARFLGALIRLWVATLRITVSSESERILRAIDRPVIFTLWHDRLFLAGEMARRFRSGRPLHALISTSRDGAWLTAFFESMGLRAVRGSSSKGGREAATELIKLLKAGHDAGITPDGPRGPAHVAKPGVLVVARRTGARIVLLGIAYEKAWRLRSWDRFCLPTPFSRAHVVARALPAEAIAGDDVSALAHIQNKLQSLNP